MRSHLKGSVVMGAILALTGLYSAQLNADVTLAEKNVLASSSADTTKPGFIWNYHQVASGQPNNNDWTELQIAGLEGDNIGDPSAVGIADAPAAAPAKSTDVITFTISTVINVDKSGGSNGNFTPDDQMPGCPGLNGGSNNNAAEILTWLDLPVGTITLGCNSDDGFRWSMGGAAPKDKFGVKVGEFNGGRGASDTTFKIVTTKAGLYATRIVWENGGGGSNCELFSVAADGTKTLLNDTANGGIKAYRAVKGSAPTFASIVTPGNGATGVDFQTALHVALVGANVKNDSSLVMKLDGAVVAATKSATGGVTDVFFQPSGNFAAGSAHSAELDYNDGTAQAITWTFTIANYGELTAAMAVTPDTSKPGFIMRTFNNQANQNNDNQSTEDALNGLEVDGSGVALPNLSDPSVTGVALAAGKPESSAANANLVWEIPGTINLDKAAGANGNFQPDDQMPGEPATDGSSNGAKADFVTYATLKKGVYTMGVNSDDGFRATAGPIKDALSHVFLGEFNGGRGASDTLYKFLVDADGTYPLRFTWENGGGGCNVEIFTVAADGTKILLNDTLNANAVKSYRATVGNSIVNPYVKVISPADGSTDQSPAPTISAIIVDGGKTVDKTSITLTANGASVTPTVTQAAGVTTVTFTPSADYPPTTKVAVALTFKDNAGSARTINWSFTTTYITRDTLFIEAEDADFGHGKTITDKKIGMDGPYPGGSFAGLGTADDEGFDWHANGPDGQAYRPDTGLSAGKENGTAGNNRGYFNVTDWWTLGWNDAGEWENYTRTFPTATTQYEVFYHTASGGSAIDWTLSLVTAGAGTATQTLQRLANVTPGRATAGWDNLEVFQATDETNGNKPAIVTIPGGKQTIQNSLRSGNGDIDYIAFRPYKAAVSTTPKLSVTWANGKYTVTSDSAVASPFKLQTASSPSGPWTDVTGVTLPYTAAPTAAAGYLRAFSP